jgi:hypothetical protein
MIEVTLSGATDAIARASASFEVTFAIRESSSCEVPRGGRMEQSGFWALARAATKKKKLAAAIGGRRMSDPPTQ